MHRVDTSWLRTNVGPARNSLSQSQLAIHAITISLANGVRRSFLAGRALVRAFDSCARKHLLVGGWHRWPRNAKRGAMATAAD